ncbi:MAG TPA: aminoacyl-tRNA hydrolase [Vicinamibacterales bacterium]|jgi:PTH1 family peptidyl-tRNA hydrolase|nr:aminoacyl-tRNA hydrolase [Vicinamibacterales bacterium]
MKAIVGLGNPGPRYKGTRHNVGFDVVDALATRAGADFESSPAAALVARARVDGSRAAVEGEGFGPAGAILLVKPMTFMNLSGQAIGDLVRYFKIDVADVLVILDEVQLPLGRLRARARGSAGGHNGLKSVIEHLGADVSRLRIGVGRGDSRRDLADHVLAKFDADEAAEAARMIARAADAAEVFVTGGIAPVMNQFNGGDQATIE